MSEQTKKTSQDGYLDIKEAAKGFLTIVGCAALGLLIATGLAHVSNKGE